MPIHSEPLSPESELTPDPLIERSVIERDAGGRVGRMLTYLFGILGLVAVGYWAVMTYGAELYQARHKQRFVAAHA